MPDQSCQQHVIITIRPATLEDAESISRLVTGLSREYITPEYSPEGAATLLAHQTPEAIQTLIAGQTRYLVAEADGVIIGAVGLLRERRHLYHLFVAAKHQRRGMGHRLWDAARAEVGPGAVTVNSSRFAIGFYERLGFVQTGPPWEKDGVTAYPMCWNSPAASG